MSSIPSELHYNADHDWVRVEGDVGTCGITDYAQGELGDIVFLELPAVDGSISYFNGYNPSNDTIDKTPMSVLISELS